MNAQARTDSLNKTELTWSLPKDQKEKAQMSHINYERVDIAINTAEFRA